MDAEVDLVGTILVVLLAIGAAPLALLSLSLLAFAVLRCVGVDPDPDPGRDPEDV